MKNQNKITGNKGEVLATQYLEKKGYRIEERNFRTRFGEIDIICWDAQTLVFVEVKTKIGHDFGEPEEMVNKRKMSQVKRMGEVYLLNNKLEAACRVDVVAVVMKDGEVVERIDHYQAVY
ncbi:MAG TPA: YraN family protein [Spirochaetia bacterium]|nr:YraN family protein [Spirochaetia bacterium]